MRQLLKAVDTHVHAQQPVRNASVLCQCATQACWQLVASDHFHKNDSERLGSQLLTCTVYLQFVPCNAYFAVCIKMPLLQHKGQMLPTTDQYCLQRHNIENAALAQTASFTKFAECNHHLPVTKCRSAYQSCSCTSRSTRNGHANNRKSNLLLTATQQSAEAFMKQNFNTASQASAPSKTSLASCGSGVGSI